MAVAVLVAAISACGDSGKNSDHNDKERQRLEQVLSNEWYYTDDTPVEFDQPVSEMFLRDGGFEYEKSVAKKFYNGKKVKYSKSRRNELVKEYGVYKFSKSGTGVFVVSDPEFSGMNHHGFYIEYTADKGKTWKICDGAYYGPAYLYDMFLSGKRVYLVLVSGVYMKSYILYSDDFCSTFRTRDVITLLPDYAEKLYYHTQDIDVISFNEKDGSMTLGWSDGEYREKCRNEGKEQEYFLTAKFNGNLTKGKVIFADDQYISESAEEVTAD